MGIRDKQPERPKESLMAPKCYDNWACRVSINLIQPNTEPEIYPCGMPLKEIARINLCMRRFSNTKLGQCRECFKETTDWIWSLRYIDSTTKLNSRISDFVKARLLRGSCDFNAQLEDLLGVEVDKKTISSGEVPF